MNKQQINSAPYLSFYDYLVGQSSVNAGESILSGEQILERLTGERNTLNSMDNYIIKLSDYQKDLQEITNELKVLPAFNLFLQEIIRVKDFSLLMLNDTSTELVPVIERMISKIDDPVNHYYKEGILSLVLDTNKAAIIPVLNSYNSNGSKQYFYFIPVAENGKAKGLFVILTPDNETVITSNKRDIIERALLLTTGKIEYLLTKKKLNDTYNELLTYQAKLANDFKLTAVGELTVGIAEEIISPLQVITTQIDLFEDNKVEKSDLDILKSQIVKINNAVNRLVKFSSSSNSNLKISPVNLNEYIIDFHNLTRSSWESIKLECVLDLDNNTPSVLSHQNYVYQILSNVFDLIKADSNGAEGVIIQTRYKQDNIVVKIISTVNLKAFDKKNNKNTGASNMNYKILENLMKKHEGKFDIISSETSGSTMSLFFPIKRKIR
ncbi:MAG TPA: hypothetical protein PK397_00520 [Ignavibacteriaceae bacterium]|jgi:hypothetical protein|nr:hypothetical protein [Ignavibacteriaceae bacterium]